LANVSAERHIDDSDSEDMNKEDFLDFVETVEWRFAKSVPNWPHFYVVEKELEDQAAFQAARSFVQDSGYTGKFFDMDVSYYDAGGWTYWASPLSEQFESRYMLNRCKTEYTHESLAKAGELPPEGFGEAPLSLAPILEDLEFQSLVRDAKGYAFTVFDVLGTADYEIRHSNVLSWLLDRDASHGQKASFLELLWEEISDSHKIPDLPFQAYSVAREGENEDEEIDLLIRADNAEWVIVIENKLFSPETGNQLERYFSYIEDRYADVPSRLYFYLTPDGIAPERDADNANWLSISYVAVRQAVSRFTENHLSDRISDFLTQYLEHIDRNVLKSTGMIEKQRNILRRHGKIFHSLTHLLGDESVREQCSEGDFEQMKSILAVQREVEREMFEFAKRMMAKHGYARHSGQGHWVTIEPPGLRDRLIQSSVLEPEDELPIVFVFDSRPHSFVVEIWLYKNKPLFRKAKSRLTRLSEEAPEPNRGDEHLVEVLFRKTIIHAEDILQASLTELKESIATYFESDLKNDLDESIAAIGDALD